MSADWAGSPLRPRAPAASSSKRTLEGTAPMAATGRRMTEGLGDGVSDNLPSGLEFDARAIATPCPLSMSTSGPTN